MKLLKICFWLIPVKYNKKIVYKNMHSTKVIDGYSFFFTCSGKPFGKGLK